MDYYQYQLLLQQQQHHQQQQQQQQHHQQKTTMASHPSFTQGASLPIQQTATASAPSMLYSTPQQMPQQSILSAQGNFKDTQFLGQPALQLQDFNIMGNLMQQQHQPFIANDQNAQIQGFQNSAAAAGVSGPIDISQQVFFQKAIQNQYINNIQQNRDDIIRNYISIISQNRNRNPSNDNRNRNPSNDNRNRNLSNENRNQSVPQTQMNNLLLQQTSSTVQNQFSAPQQFTSTFQAQQVFQQQQQQQAQQQQQLFSQAIPSQQSPSWIQAGTTSATALPEMNKQFLGDASFQTLPIQQQRHSNHHLHHHQQQQQQLQMNMGINMNDLQKVSQQQSASEKNMGVQSNGMLNYTQQQQQIKSTIIQAPVATLQKSNDDALIESFDQENIRLQQQITILSSKLLQLNQSQAEIITLNNFNMNKGIIDFLEQQIQLYQSQKKQVLEQIENLQTLKLAYQKFKQACPEGTSHQFMSLSKETQLLFLNQPSSNIQQVSPIQMSASNLKIEHTPLQLQFSSEAHSTLQTSSGQHPTQDDQKSVSSKNSSSSNQKKNPFKVIRSNENSEDQDIAFLNRRRDTPVQSPSLSKVTQQAEQNTQKDKIIEKQPIIEEQAAQVSQIEEIKPIEQDSAKEIEQPQQKQNDIGNSNEENNKIDEEEEDHDHDHDHDDHDHDFDDNDNTTLAQTTMSVALKLSSMNPAESKKFEKRREKLEENVLKILEKSEDACSKIKPIALELCSKIAVESDVLKNRPYEAISAAVIVHASRLVANPITVKKMAKITESKEKIINRVFMYLKKNVEGFNNKMPQPEVFIKNICDKMKLSEPISKTAFFLHSQSDNLGLVKGQHAATVAACIVKLAACLNNVDMTVKQICEASNVCQISLRQLYRTIYPHRFELIGDHKINDIDFKKILNSPQLNLD